jgi:phage terminase large subunit-like protein
MTSTTSPRSASRLEPFTVEHFRKYAHGLRLDNGERFVLEPFQVEVAADIFAGFSEVWKIVPEGNGKTTFMSALALYHGDYTETAFVPIGASSREQAEILYRQAEGFVYRTPGLKDRFKCQEGYRRIKCSGLAAVSRCMRLMIGRRTGSFRRSRCSTSSTGTGICGCIGRGAGSC